MVIFAQFKVFCTSFYVDFSRFNLKCFVFVLFYFLRQLSTLPIRFYKYKTFLFASFLFFSLLSFSCSHLKICISFELFLSQMFHHFPFQSSFASMYHKLCPTLMVQHSACKSTEMFLIF